MGILSVNLPPFAPDYSGVCSFFFPFPALIVIHDGQGCTANYTGFDEPRWYGSRKAVFCSGLRKLDVALGNDAKYIQRICQAAKELKPEIVVLVGSPVPLVAGTDLEGMAREIEDRLGIPTFAFSSNGLGNYLDGISMAGQHLLDRLLIKPIKRTNNRYVNLLGATPLDFSEEMLNEFSNIFLANGWKLRTVLCHKLGLEDVLRLPEAHVNIALNLGGVDLAEWLRQFYGMPYLVGLPVGKQGTKIFFEKLAEVADEESSASYHLLPKGGKKKDGKTLIIYEAVIAHSIAIALAACEPGAWIEVATPFNKLHETIFSQTTLLESEKKLKEALENTDLVRVIADPLFLALLPAESAVEKVPIPHFAVSSHVGQPYVRQYLGENFERNILNRSIR